MNANNEIKTVSTMDILAKFMTQDELKRIIINESVRYPEITVDVHQMRRSETRRYLSNLIAAIRKKCTLLIIHGYNNGHAIKDMLWTEHDQISSRITALQAGVNNPGMTILRVQQPMQ